MFRSSAVLSVSARTSQRTPSAPILEKIATTHGKHFRASHKVSVILSYIYNNLPLSTNFSKLAQIYFTKIRTLSVALFQTDKQRKAIRVTVCRRFCYASKKRHLAKSTSTESVQRSTPFTYNFIISVCPANVHNNQCS
jgi:hypothetical protein